MPLPEASEKTSEESSGSLLLVRFAHRGTQFLSVHTEVTWLQETDLL